MAASTKETGMIDHAEITAVIALLAEQYPRTFSVYERRRRPLKLGIHPEISET
jgi:sRNA-binding protein